MKKIFLLILLPISQLYLQGQTLDYKDTLKTKDSTVTKEFYLKKYYKNGITKKEGKICQRKYSEKYDNQYMIGTWKTYYRNGQLKDSTFYDWNSNIIGIKKIYYKNGRIKEIIDFDTLKSFLIEEATLSTKVTYYWTDFYLKAFYNNSKNVICKEGRKKDLAKTGLWKYYDKNGKLEKDVYYEDGRKKSKIEY